MKRFSTSLFAGSAEERESPATAPSMRLTSCSGKRLRALMSAWACTDGKLDLARPSVKLAEERGERSRRERKRKEERERDRSIVVKNLRVRESERERDENGRGICEEEREKEQVATPNGQLTEATGLLALGCNGE